MQCNTKFYLVSRYDINFLFFSNIIQDRFSYFSRFLIKKTRFSSTKNYKKKENLKGIISRSNFPN